MRIPDQILVLIVSFALAFLLSKAIRQPKAQPFLYAGLAALAAFFVGRSLGIF